MNRLHRAMGLTALLLGGGAAAVDSLAPAPPARATAVSLAERIKAGERLHVFDLRAQADYERFHIPSAERTTIPELRGLALPRSAAVVLYGDDAATSARASALLRAHGYRDVAYLPDGLHEWILRVHEPALAVDATPAERAEFEQLAALSRYFGGQPRIDVPRAKLPAAVATSLLVAAIRRRGC
jgi:rhodanese-related sulfurtransferase